MSDFFNNYLNIPKILEEKRKYKAQMARVDALPEDYTYVLKKIYAHTWMFSSGSGRDMLDVHVDLLELFEEGAANGKHVLDITGEDVAEFVEEILRNSKTWTGDWKSNLNKDIAKKVGKRGSKFEK